tara:strand:+ start:715 stop:1011 length:297 start_codon:yes stop_codon:yes gene_type:complete
MDTLIDVYDNDILIESLYQFEPPEEMAIRLYIVYCGCTNNLLLNEDEIIKGQILRYLPHQITLELIYKIFDEFYSEDINRDYALNVFEEFQRIFVKQG